MLLGDLIARFQNDASADETLLSLGDLALTAHVIARGAENDLTPGVFVIELVGQFVNRATDEEWLSLIGQMSRSDNPSQVFLRRVIGMKQTHAGISAGRES